MALTARQAMELFANAYGKGRLDSTIQGGAHRIILQYVDNKLKFVPYGKVQEAPDPSEPFLESYRPGGQGRMILPFDLDDLKALQKFRQPVNAGLDACAGAVVQQRQLDDLSGGLPGTLGWNFMTTEGRFILGNRHVLRSLGDKFHISMYFGGDPVEVGSLRGYEEWDLYGPNAWDLAIARYRDSILVSPSYVLSNAGAKPVYPMQISETLEYGERVYKVGSSSTKTTSVFLGVGYEFDYPLEKGSSYLVVDQLYFENFTDKGDSGSVIVRCKDAAIIGLAMGEDPVSNVSIANPICSMGWSVSNVDPASGLPIVVDCGKGRHRNWKSVEG
jgi:hypothetical protein